ncbi:type II toxin-antitoxin system RelE/ParE family toxin [Candidatus Peregrinibacteria bacterium]|nr:type II toxin-antitoxin system RelE/ParE family toxin [Candidatus Peregrinibacteria bacterium]
MKIFFTEYFKKQLRKLKKKYPQVNDDLLNVIELFDEKRAISIGRSIYKIRIPSSDMKKGKLGGFRAYVYFYVAKDLLLPLCMYAKSETEAITENELEYHFHQTIQEIVEKI